MTYIFGLARNNRLVKKIAQAAEEGKETFLEDWAGSTVLPGFQVPHTEELEPDPAGRWQGGAAQQGGESPIRGDLAVERSSSAAKALYEDLYCARGDMENRIKEQQTWSVRRPDQLHDFLRQPAQALVFRASHTSCSANCDGSASRVPSLLELSAAPFAPSS